MNKRLLPYLLITLVSLAIPDSDYSESLIWLCSFLAMFISMFFLFNYESNNNIKTVFLRPSFLFVLAYLVVFFQRPIDYTLGYSFSYIQLGDSRYMMTSVKYALIGLCLFCIGYQIESQKIHTVNKSYFHIKQVSPSFYAFLSSVIVGLVFVLVPREILMGGYSNDLLTNATMYNYLASWSNTILIAYIVQFTLNAKQSHKLYGCTPITFLKSIGLWQNINVILYCYLILNVGDRGPIIVLAFAYYISYIIVAKKRLSKIKLIAALVVGIMLSSILGDTKQYRDNNTIVDRLTSVFENKTYIQRNSFLPATDQLAGSYCCLPLALQLVPNQEDYTYGEAMLSEVSSSIPFSGRLLTLPESSSYRISKYAMGDGFTFGLGTNCIAALYMDGGFIFVILGMLLFGILLRKFEVCIFSDTTSSLFVFCMAFYFLTRMIYIPRSTILSPFKYALWMYFVMVLYAKFSPEIKKR